MPQPPKFATWKDPRAWRDVATGAAASGPFAVLKMVRFDVAALKKAHAED